MEDLKHFHNKLILWHHGYHGMYTTLRQSVMSATDTTKFGTKGKPISTVHVRSMNGFRELLD